MQNTTMPDEVAIVWLMWCRLQNTSASSEALVNTRRIPRLEFIRTSGWMLGDEYDG